MWPLVISAVVAGLSGSAHCLGMCGGIATAVGMNASRQRYIYAYHAGRLLSYMLLGMLLGSILPILGVKVALPAVTRVLRQISAILVILVGVQVALNKDTISRWLERCGLFLWHRIRRVGQQFIPVCSHSDALLLGLCWGLLPCGMIYTALAIAVSTGNPLKSSMFMLAFGIGTLPAMLSVTLFSQTFGRWLANIVVRRAFGVVLIALGIVAFPA